jgi:hypothetical protein
MQRYVWYCALIVLTGPLIACGEHNRVDYDFESPAPGISPMWLTRDAHGNTYLGPLASGTALLMVMDALPALNGATGLVDTATRKVELGFDLVVPSSPFPFIADRFKVYANDVLILERLGVQLWTSAGRRRIDVTFPLIYQVAYDPQFGFPYPFDMRLRFEKEGSSAVWGLDNLVVDWSQPVPEPASWFSAIVGVLGLMVVSRRAGWRR